MQKAKSERRGEAGRAATDGLVERIRETLLAYGGEVHRRAVIETLARDRGLDVRKIPQDLEMAVISSFEAAWRDEAKRAAYGFTLRFGEGSHRWGVTARAH